VYPPLTRDFDSRVHGQPSNSLSKALGDGQREKKKEKKEIPEFNCRILGFHFSFSFHTQEAQRTG
jgi:hypothetical protein